MKAPRGVQFFAIAGMVLVALLLHRFWFGSSGWFAARALAEEIAAQDRRTEQLAQRNRILTAEVMALKQGLDAVEDRARTDLGMVAEGETFYLVVDADDRPRQDQSAVGEDARAPR